METIYDVSYFINKFQSIPKDKWLVGTFCSKGDDSKRCAFGHCGMITGGAINKEAQSLEELFSKINITHIYGLPVVWKVTAINDGDTKEYKQKTPQQRILAALHDVKKLQQTEKSKTIIIEKIKYVSVSESITKEVSFINN